LHFFTQKRCISALPKFNQLLDFFNLFDSLLILMLFYDSLNLVINALISRLLGAWFRINEVESLQKLDCVTRTTHHSIALFSGFSISQGNAEALAKRGGKTKRRLISTFSVIRLPKIIVIGSCMSRL